MNGTLLTIGEEELKNILQDSNENLTELETKNLMERFNCSKEELFQLFLSDDKITDKDIGELCNLFNGYNILDKPFEQITQEEIDQLIEYQTILQMINHIGNFNNDVEKIVYQKLEENKQKQLRQKIEMDIQNTPLRIEMKEKNITQKNFDYDTIDIWHMTLKDIQQVPNSKVRRVLKKAFRNYYIYLNRFVTKNMIFDLEKDFTLFDFAVAIRKELPEKKKGIKK